MSSVFWNWLPLAGFALLWGDLIHQLSYNWSTNEQYSYGWLVPLLALGLFCKRWITRPSPEGAFLPGGQPAEVSLWGRRLLSILIVLAALFLLPVRVIHEINQDWPTITWPLALLVVTLSLYATFLVGGWPWVKHFAFPICFILAAVRWPNCLEAPLVQGLMRVVASVSVEVLGWLNVPCVQRGNLIEISSGVVGVNEACSGIRSLQSAFMAGLFMGELYLFRWSWRVLFLACGFVLAFGFNCLRVIGLTWKATASGTAEMEKWHDSAGLSIVVACFVCLWILAAALRGRSRSQKQDPVLHPPACGSLRSSVKTLSRADAAIKPCDPEPGFPQTRLAGALLPRIRSYAILLGCWCLCIIAFTHLWYRRAVPEGAEAPSWSVSLPRDNPTFRQIDLSADVLRRLQHDSATLGAWQEPDGSDWTVYFLRWNPRPVQFVTFNRRHRPDACLPGSGFIKLSESGLDYIPIGPIQVPFHRYTFQGEGDLLHVFFCVWEDTSGLQKGNVDATEADRLEWVMAGRRRMGHQTLEIILKGYQSMEVAEEALRRRLADLVRVERVVSHGNSNK